MTASKLTCCASTRLLDKLATSVMKFSNLKAYSWEEQAQQTLKTTTSQAEVRVICSLLPVDDDAAMIGILEARSDLDVLFALFSRKQDLSAEQRANPLGLAADVKAHKIWRVLRMPDGYGKSPRDWDWQLPQSGSPATVAARLYAETYRAIFRIPLLDFVNCALGRSNRADFVGSLLDAVCQVRDNLRQMFQENSTAKNIYIQVELILREQPQSLAHWIIASSLKKAEHTPYDALTPMLKSITTIFATRNLVITLKQLHDLDQRFRYVNMNYDWDEWSNDFQFCNSASQAAWSGKPATPHLPQLSMEDEVAKVRFVEGFRSLIDCETRGDRGWWKKLISSTKRIVSRRGYRTPGCQPTS